MRWQRLILLSILTLSAAAFGCGDDTSTATETDVFETDTSSSDGVAGETAEPELPSVMRFMVRTMTFPLESEPGVVTGFDLDGHVSDGNGPDDCGVQDFVGPNGEPGIDNQMALLTPAFEPVGLGQAFAYLENSIEDSGFFLLFELRDVDSLQNDDSIEMVYELGGGSAVMDSEDDVAAYQTMCVQNDSPSVLAAEARIEDGFVYARFDELVFTMSMFERVYPFVFKDLQLKARIDEAGFLVDGVVGGTLTLANMMQLVIKGAQNTGGLLGPMTALLNGLGDLPSADGPCTAMSTTFDFTAVPVFFFPKDSGCDPCGNAVCEYFESCETCLEDCCEGCGNGSCDNYPFQIYEVAIGEEGFEPAILDLLVGDGVTWTNETAKEVQLICDDFGGSQAVAASESSSFVATGSGTFSCRIHGQAAQVQPLYVADNHSETCESCPQDCGECE